MAATTATPGTHVSNAQAAWLPVALLTLLHDHIFDQRFLVDLPHGIARNLVSQPQYLGYLMRRQAIRNILLQAF